MSIDLNNVEMSIDVEFRTKEILDSMMENMSSDELIEAIKYIDGEMCDVEFTKEVYEYFEEQAEIDEEPDEGPNPEKEDLDVITTVAIIKGIIVATHKNPAVIHGVLDYIQEIEDNR